MEAEEIYSFAPNANAYKPSPATGLSHEMTVFDHFPDQLRSGGCTYSRQMLKSESFGNYLKIIWQLFENHIKNFFKKVLTFSIYRSSLVVEQRANAKNRIRLPEIQYFREPLAGVKRCMSMVIILCEQCTEFLHDK